MAVQIYTSDKTSPRGFSWIWFIRLFQIVITIVVLGITAAGVTSFHDLGCNAPSKLDFNLAVSVIALFGLLYFFFATGPRAILRILPWFVWGQIFLDGLLLVFWLAASATSRYNCSDLCNACNFGYDEVWFDNLFCYCNVILYKRDTSPAPKGLARSLEPRRASVHYGGSSVGAKVGLDAIMTVLFAVTLASSIFWFIRTRNTSTATTSHPNANTHVESGVPLGTAQPKQDTYTQQQPTYPPAATVQPQPTYGGPEMQSQPAYGQPAPEYPVHGGPAH